MAYYNYNYNYKTSVKAPKATDKYKKNKVGTIVVTVQPGKGLDIKTKQPYKVINLYNVDAESAKAIVDRLNDETKNRTTRNAWIDKTEPTHVQIKVFDSEIDQWLDGGDLNAIQSVLLKSGNYDTEEIMHLEDEIATGFYSKNWDKISTAHNEASENSMEMWQNYLSKINDPVTLEQIKLYSRVYGNTTYGHILSARNANLIRSYDSDATFVLRPSQWREFGRGVKRNAKPLPMYVWRPDRKITDKDFEDAKNSNGWEDTETEDLSMQVKKDIAMKANKSNGRIVQAVGYDVRDTYLLSGMKEDPWTNQIGLLNNLNGELNRAAIADKEARGVKEPENKDVEMEQRTERAANWMEEYCKESGYKVSTPFTDASNRLADYLLEYFKTNATKKANILKEANVNTYSENATQVTLILTRLAWGALSRFNRTYTYDKKEAAALMNVVFGIARKLEENSMLNEGVFGWLRDKVAFAKQFLQALKQIGCKVVDSKPEDNNTANNNAEEAPAEVDADAENNAQNDTLLEGIKTEFSEFFNKINKQYF